MSKDWVRGAREDSGCFRYGVRIDDPDVQEAMATLRAMLPGSQAEFLRSILCGYVAFLRNGRTAVLAVVAVDAAATFRMHRNPAYVAALAAMPDKPTGDGTGRDVEDIFRKFRGGAE